MTQQQAARSPVQAGGARETRVYEKTQLCKFYRRGRCTKGTLCGFAHGREDLHSPPDFFKTVLCHAYTRLGICKTGAECSFAHDSSELRPYAGPPIRGPGKRGGAHGSPPYSETAPSLSSAAVPLVQHDPADIGSSARDLIADFSARDLISYAVHHDTIQSSPPKEEASVAIARQGLFGCAPSDFPFADEIRGSDVPFMQVPAHPEVYSLQPLAVALHSCGLESEASGAAGVNNGCAGVSFSGFAIDAVSQPALENQIPQDMERSMVGEALWETLMDPPHLAKGCGGSSSSSTTMEPDCMPEAFDPSAPAWLPMMMAELDEEDGDVCEFGARR